MIRHQASNADKQAFWARLMSLPVDNPDRPSLRVAIPYSHKTLERMTRKYLTLSPVFQRANPLQVHELPAPKCSVEIAQHPRWWRDWCNGPCRCGQCAICLERKSNELRRAA